MDVIEKVIEIRRTKAERIDELEIVLIGHVLDDLGHRLPLREHLLDRQPGIFCVGVCSDVRIVEVVGLGPRGPRQTDCLPCTAGAASFGFERPEGREPLT